MNNLDILYRQVIKDHKDNPRNKGLKGYKHLHLKNPSCGDDITIEADIKDGVVKEVRHDGNGCLICCSSASTMCELLSGKTVEEVENLTKTFYDMLMGEDVDTSDLDEVQVLQGVSQFPQRIKCATLPWKALERIMNGEDDE